MQAMMSATDSVPLNFGFTGEPLLKCFVRLSVVDEKERGMMRAQRG